jgi:actin-related protein
VRSINVRLVIIDFRGGGAKQRRIEQCPVDVRRAMAANLVVVGGTAAMLGLKKRLLQELRLQSTRSDMAPYTFKLHKPPVPDNCVTWLGGEGSARLLLICCW